MPRPSWITPEQGEWFCKRQKAFNDAQDLDAKARRKFWKGIYKDWFGEFPLSPATPEEIEAAGNEESALAKKRVSQRERVYYWFHNHYSRAATTRTAQPSTLDLTGRTRKLHSDEAYIKMFWNDPKKGLKAERDRRWQATSPSTTRVPPTFTKTIAAEMLDRESPEVKAQVEAFRDSYDMSPAMMLDVSQARLELVQGSIDALPQTLDRIAASIERQTGWKVCFLTGGPNPMKGGRISTFIVQRGETLGTAEHWDEVDAAWEETVKQSYIDFLGQCYTAEMCSRMALDGSNAHGSPATSDRSLTPDTTPSTTPMALDNTVIPPNPSNSSSTHINEIDHRLRELPFSESTIPSTTINGKQPTPEATRTSSMAGAQQDAAGVSPLTPSVALMNVSTPPGTPPVLFSDVDCRMEKSSVTSAGAGAVSRPTHTEAVASTGSGPSPLASSVGSSARAPRAVSSSPSSVPGSDPASTASTLALLQSSPASSATSLNSPPPPPPTSPASASDLSPRSSVLSATSSMETSLPSTPSSPLPPSGVPTAFSASRPSLPATRTSRRKAAQAGTESSASPSSPPAKSNKVPGFKSNHPQWMPELVKQLRSISSDASWVNLVDSWLLLEDAVKDSKGLLPTFERPEQVFWWNKRGKHTSSVPDLSDGDVLTTFCTKWDAWYNSMQPEWRQHQDGLPMDKTAGRGGWDGLAVGGGNGFLVIVMTVAWHVVALDTCPQDMKEQFSCRVVNIIEDVAWVIDQVRVSSPEAGKPLRKKRAAQVSSVAAPASKRAKCA